MPQNGLAKKTANLLPGGRVGNKGGSGRPSKALLQRYEALIKKGDPMLAEVAEGKHGPQPFLNLHLAMVERLHGKVPQKTELDHELTVRIVREDKREE
jgi:hypothetical protein